MPTMRFVFLLAFGIGFLPIFQAGAQVCPPPRQPELGQTLKNMIDRGRYLDVRDCVDHLSAAEEADSYSDEVRYQLASQFRDALDKEQGVTTSAQAAQKIVRLWMSYVEFAQPDYDPVRHRQAFLALVRFSAYSKFQDFRPSIINAMERADGKLISADARLFFEIIRRCPSYSNISNPLRNISCQQDCASFFRTVSKEIAESLTRATQLSGPARSAFLQNNEALLRDVAACPRD